MAHPWSPEVVVSADLARSLIEAQFPALAPARAEPLGAGWDNAAFRVNGSYVFRFPQRQLAVPFLETETRVMPAVAPRLPLAAPAPLFVGRPAGGYPWPFAGYARIPGRTACAANLDEGQRAAAAEPLGRFLAALHAFPAADAARAGAGPDTLGRLDLPRRRPWARERLADLAARGLVADVRPFTALLDAAPPTCEPRADTLVHGDLYARHLLVDEAGRLDGVIDWGDVHLGDPAVDLMIAHTFLPPEAHPAFRRAYGPVAGQTWALARLRGLWHSLAVVGYAAEVGDADLLREGQTGLGYLAAGCGGEVPPQALTPAGGRG
jgi:aminoglycoside phosphotransferase (APT) family kinase protein